MTRLGTWKTLLSGFEQKVLPSTLIFFTVFSVLLVTVTVTGMGSPW